MAYQSESVPEIPVVGGAGYRVTRHARERIQERNIQKEWVTNVLSNWIARKYDARNESMGYFGVVGELSHLLRVAVSNHSSAITTVYPDSNATLNYYRGYHDYFDEVRDSRNAS